jgi:phosphoheptose isomerase
MDKRTKFPVERTGAPDIFCCSYFDELAAATRSVDPELVGHAAIMLAEAYTSGSTVFACGNGGSAAVANHLQCDHTKGVRTGTDFIPRVVSLSSNLDLITAIANDIGYADIFRYQLESLARPGDVLVAISSSGRSPNVVDALRWAQSHEMRTISLTGFDGGESAKVSQVSIHVDCSNYGVVEDTHQAVMHSMAQYIRQSHMSDEAVASHTF